MVLKDNTNKEVFDKREKELEERQKLMSKQPTEKVKRISIALINPTQIRILQAVTMLLEGIMGVVMTLGVMLFGVQEQTINLIL